MRQGEGRMACLAQKEPEKRDFSFSYLLKGKISKIENSILYVHKFPQLVFINVSRRVKHYFF